MPILNWAWIFLGVRTWYVRAAVGPLLADLHRPGMARTVHLVSAQHVKGGNGCLRQVAMGGVSAAH